MCCEFRITCADDSEDREQAAHTTAGELQRHLFRLQSATPNSINLKLFGEPIIIGFENLKSEIALRV
jgi:hypothetical protein